MHVKAEKPDDKQLDALGVKNWPIWEKEKSEFDWYYDDKETCYFLEGDVEIDFSDGGKVKVGKGDLVIFPKGLRCRWNIKQKVKKHYNFG